MTKTVRVVFDSIDEDGLVRCTVLHASGRLYIGDMVLAIEGPDHTYVASVASIGSNGTIRLQIDPATWRHELVG